MNLFNNSAKKLLIGAIASLLISNSFAATKITEGTDYTIIASPQSAPNSNGKISVMEFFSYSCIHCATLDPLIEKWKASPAAKNVTLQKIQIVWEGSLIGYAKLNATIEALNLQRISTPAFNAIMNERKDLQDIKQLKAFLTTQKVDIPKFMAVYNSFAIDAKTKEYASLTKKYNIMGTPTVIVNNQYQVSPAQPARIMEITQALVDKSLASNNTKKK